MLSRRSIRLLCTRQRGSGPPPNRSFSAGPNTAGTEATVNLLDLIAKAARILGFDLFSQPPKAFGEAYEIIAKLLDKAGSSPRLAHLPAGRGSRGPTVSDRGEALRQGGADRVSGPRRVANTVARSTDPAPVRNALSGTGAAISGQVYRYLPILGTYREKLYDCMHRRSRTGRRLGGPCRRKAARGKLVARPKNPRARPLALSRSPGRGFSRPRRTTVG